MSYNSILFPLPAMAKITFPLSLFWSCSCFLLFPRLLMVGTSWLISLYWRLNNKMWSIQSFWPLIGVKQIAPTRRSDQIAASISIEGGPLKPFGNFFVRRNGYQLPVYKDFTPSMIQLGCWGKESRNYLSHFRTNST